MAKIIDSKIESRNIHVTYSIWPILLIGMLTGITYWCLTFLINQHISSVVISNNIATVASAALGMLIMLSQRLDRPLIVTLASAAALWNIVTLTEGLMLYESIVWVIALHSLAYVLFSWISRYSKTFLVVVAAFIIVAAVRIVLTL